MGSLVLITAFALHSCEIVALVLFHAYLSEIKHRTEHYVDTEPSLQQSNGRVSTFQRGTRLALLIYTNIKYK